MAKLNEKNRAFLDSVIERFVDEGTRKFCKGVVEHADDLDTLPALELIREAKQESIDQFIYMCKLEDLLTEMFNRQKEEGNARV